MDLLGLMAIPRERLGEGSGVQVVVGGDAADLDRRMALEMAELVADNHRDGRPTVAIVPVGPVGQYAEFARFVNDRGIDCRGVTFVMMDEFLDGHGRWIDHDHPLSFRGFLRRALADVPGLRVVVPDPEDTAGVTRLLEAHGGADVCFGGIGLNGHVAFNEPESVPIDDFAARTCRVVGVAPASRAHMAINLSCDLHLIPEAAVTVGMKEILGARRLSLYASRPWHNGVIRKVLHGPVSAACPASLSRLHAAAGLTVTSEVAEPREVRLR